MLSWFRRTLCSCWSSLFHGYNLPHRPLHWSGLPLGLPISASLSSGHSRYSEPLEPSSLVAPITFDACSASGAASLHSQAYFRWNSTSITLPEVMWQFLSFYSCRIALSALKRRLLLLFSQVHTNSRLDIELRASFTAYFSESTFDYKCRKEDTGNIAFSASP